MHGTVAEWLRNLGTLLSAAPLLGQAYPSASSSSKELTEGYDLSRCLSQSPPM